jgi:hypothetical protein
MISVQLTYKYNHGTIYLFYFEKHNNPIHLIVKGCFSICIDKFERLLYISGLKNEKNCDIYNNSIYMLYMYNIKDFDRCIQILKLLYLEYTFTYDRKEVINFFDKVK